MLVAYILGATISYYMYIRYADMLFVRQSLQESRSKSNSSCNSSSISTSSSQQFNFNELYLVGYYNLICALLVCIGILYASIVGDQIVETYTGNPGSVTMLTRNFVLGISMGRVIWMLGLHYLITMVVIWFDQGIPISNRAIAKSVVMEKLNTVFAMSFGFTAMALAYLELR
jgi:F0F1-type ATP synthase membrane subunit c/vacuolar-type H+-ATPase subunit K